MPKTTKAELEERLDSLSLRYNDQVELIAHLQAENKQLKWAFVELAQQMDRIRRDLPR